MTKSTAWFFLSNDLRISSWCSVLCDLFLLFLGLSTVRDPLGTNWHHQCLADKWKTELGAPDLHICESHEKCVRNLFIQQRKREISYRAAPVFLLNFRHWLDGDTKWEHSWCHISLKSTLSFFPPACSPFSMLLNLLSYSTCCINITRIHCGLALTRNVLSDIQAVTNWNIS